LWFRFYPRFFKVIPRFLEGGRLEARLTGFRGGEGILELAQRKGQNPKLLAIMTGLQENKPWTDIDFHILDDGVIDKVVIVVEAGTSNVIDCGKLQIHGNVSDWQRAINGGLDTIRVTVLHVIALLVTVLIFV
ncbi:hypothetical protein ANCDUO_16236, partial [Ancylostoma duodenale]